MSKSSAYIDKKAVHDWLVDNGLISADDHVDHVIIEIRVTGPASIWVHKVGDDRMLSLTPPLIQETPNAVPKGSEEAEAPQGAETPAT